MKQVTGIIIMLLATQAGRAQKAESAVSMHVEAGFPKDCKAGVGVFLHGGLGITSNALLTLQAGFASFSSEGLPDHKATTTKVIPVMVGYKHHIKGFFLEPQFGYGALNSRVDIGEDYARHSNGAFIWAVGAGYQLNQLVMGVRYQSAVGKAYTGAGRKDQFGFVGINLGYQLFK